MEKIGKRESRENGYSSFANRDEEAMHALPSIEAARRVPSYE